MKAFVRPVVHGQPKRLAGAAKCTVGIGLALLLIVPAGGALTVWNANLPANMGTITAGNINLQAQPGSWTSNVSGPIYDISSYRVVPGETLEYRQSMDVELLGDGLAAKLTVIGAAGVNQGFAPGTTNAPQVTIEASNGSPLANPLTASVVGAVASTLFVFNEETTNRDSTNQTYDFSGVRFYLRQVTSNEVIGVSSLQVRWSYTFGNYFVALWNFENTARYSEIQGYEVTILSAADEVVYNSTLTAAQTTVAAYGPVYPSGTYTVKVEALLSDGTRMAAALASATIP